MGIYGWIDRKVFKGKLPGGYEKPKEVKKEFKEVKPRVIRGEKVDEKGRVTSAPIVGDTPSGSVSELPSSSPGVTKVTYKKSSGGGSSGYSRTITPPKEEVKEVKEVKEKLTPSPTEQKIDIPKLDPSKKTLEIQPAGSDYEQRKAYQNRYKQGWWQSFLATGENIFNKKSYIESKKDKLARARSVTDTSGPKIKQPSVRENIIEPFKETKDEGFKPTAMPKYGSISPGESPFYTGFEIEEKNLKEPEEKILIKRFGYQDKVNKGELTPEEASNSFKEEIKEEIKEINKIKKGSSSLYESSAYKTAKNIPTYADIGLSVIPTVGPIYLAGSGAYKSLKLSQKEKEGYKISGWEQADVGLRFGFGANLISKGATYGKTSLTKNVIKEGELALPRYSKTNLLTPTDDGIRLAISVEEKSVYGFEQFSKTTSKLKKSNLGYDIIGGSSSKTTGRYFDFERAFANEYPWVSSTKSSAVMGEIEAGSMEGLKATSSKLSFIDYRDLNLQSSFRAGPYIEPKKGTFFSLNQNVIDQTKTFIKSGKEYKLVDDFINLQGGKEGLSFGVTVDKSLYSDDFIKTYGGRTTGGGSNTPFLSQTQKQLTIPIQINTPTIKFNLVKPFKPSKGGLGLDINPSSKTTQTNQDFIFNQSNKLNSAMMFDETPGQKVSSALYPSFKTIQLGSSKPSQGFTPAVYQIPGIKTSPLTKQDFEMPGVPSLTPFFPSFKSPNDFIPKQPKVGGSGFIPFDFRLFDYGRKKTKKGMGRKKGRYAPTITAIGLNIKAPKVSNLYKKGFGAFSIRPIIGKNKKIKRSKPKKRNGNKK